MVRTTSSVEEYLILIPQLTHKYDGTAGRTIAAPSTMHQVMLFIFVMIAINIGGACLVHHTLVSSFSRINIGSRGRRRHTGMPIWHDSIRYYIRLLEWFDPFIQSNLSKCHTASRGSVRIRYVLLRGIYCGILATMTKSATFPISKYKTHSELKLTSLSGLTSSNRLINS